MRTANYTSGSIGRQILGLALPIMGTAFIQMAYTLADIFWIGHLGSVAAAAVGATGIYMWLGTSLGMMTKVGAEISISQSLGKRHYALVNRYARHALALSIVFGVAYGLLLLVFRSPLVDFFELQSPACRELGLEYLSIIAFGMVFTFANSTYFGLYNGIGHSRMAFIANGIGLGLNLLLDPLLINGYMGFPQLGVAGAAYATVVSQGLVSLIFWGVNLPREASFHSLFKGFRPARALSFRIIRLGFPVAAQSVLFAVIGLVIARFVAQWSDVGVAVQAIGAEIEAITWMTAGGFASALGSFVGQNWGARNYARIRQGYVKTLMYTLTLGAVATLLFILVGAQIFFLFLPERAAMLAGSDYLRIMGYSQLFMVLEITTSGVFNGIGKTAVPAITGVSLNLLRIPLALWWGAYSLTGIWWAIAISSILKGSVLWAWLLVEMRRFPDGGAASSPTPLQH